MSRPPAMSTVRLVLVALAGLAAAPVHADPGATEPAATLRVFPPAVHLSSARDRQSLVVQLVEPNGITRDVTAEAAIGVDEPARARLDGRMIVPVADGDTAVTVTHAGLTSAVPIHVEGAGRESDLSFRLDVMPIFMRAGCNAGSCHGSARGKDGFRLSLFGFDPSADHHRITRELPGRRVNVALPVESLLLTKATAAVPHGGGARLRADDEHFAMLRRWLEAGAANDPGPMPAVVKLSLSPTDAVLDGPGATQQFTVLATYADGTDRDVTKLAVFLSGNDAAAAIDASGRVTAGGRGEAFVMARFATHTVGSPVISLPAGLAFTWSAPPAANRIDELVHAKLRTLRINPAPLCGDAEFLRRASLDICGVLPTSDECRSFVANPDPEKRRHLVEALLTRPEFVDLWTMKWSELLMVRTVPNQVGPKAVLLEAGWLRDRLAADTPIDALVRELLTAKGSTLTTPAANYFQQERDTLKTAENVAQVFMGMRIQCAQCHNHPFDRWTMDDYYGFANFFAQVGRKPGEDPRETIVFDAGTGDVKHPVGGRIVPPTFLGGAAAETAGRDRREVLANWLTSADNPHFGRNLVNIVWAHFLGRGLVDEVDDVRTSNPPVNEPLLDDLARRFVASKYDFKWLVREICTSHTYQRSTRPDDTSADDDRNFSKALLRRIRAEVLLDVVSTATGTRDKFKALPLGARAVQIADGTTSTYFLTTFGRATRATACSCEVRMEPNLSQALHLLNGDTIQQKIRQGGVVKKLLDDGRTPEQVIEELYLRTLTRPPTEQETRGLMEIIGADPAALRETLEDGFWAILNSREFVFNH